jgi:hypothetical protein
MTTQGESQLEVAKALYAVLVAETATGHTLHGVGIHDSVTQASTFPYIVIGEFNPSDYSTKSDAGMDLDCQIHIWSQSTSSLELKTIQQSVYNILHNKPLTVVGQINYLLRFVRAIGLAVEQDNITRHAVQSYRILTQATA